MSFPHWIAVAMLAALPMAAIAEQATQAGPADATGGSTAAAYESVFKSYRSATEEQESPDKAWRAANEMVGKLGGHSGHMEQGNDADPSQPAQREGATMPMHQGHGAHH